MFISVNMYYRPLKPNISTNWIYNLPQTYCIYKFLEFLVILGKSTYYSNASFYTHRNILNLFHRNKVCQDAQCFKDHNSKQFNKKNMKCVLQLKGQSQITLYSNNYFSLLFIVSLPTFPIPFRVFPHCFFSRTGFSLFWVIWLLSTLDFYHIHSAPIR